MAIPVGVARGSILDPSQFKLYTGRLPLNESSNNNLAIEILEDVGSFGVEANNHSLYSFSTRFDLFPQPSPRFTNDRKFALCERYLRRDRLRDARSGS
jgi:hypothetical protein